MSAPSHRRLRAAAVVLAASAALTTCAACDASEPAPSPSPSGSSVATRPGGSTTADTSTPPESSAETTPTTTGPATPTATPGTFAIAVAGAGQVTYPVAAVRCGAGTVTGTATPPDGAADAGGTVTLEAASGVLTVTGLAPLDGTRLTGTTTGTPATGATVQWTGDGTGSAASLTVTCP